MRSGLLSRVAQHRVQHLVGMTRHLRDGDAERANSRRSTLVRIVRVLAKRWCISLNNKNSSVSCNTKQSARGAGIEILKSQNCQSRPPPKLVRCLQVLRFAEPYKAARAARTGEFRWFGCCAHPFQSRPVEEYGKREDLSNARWCRRYLWTVGVPRDFTLRSASFRTAKRASRQSYRLARADDAFIEPTACARPFKGFWKDLRRG